MVKIAFVYDAVYPFVKGGGEKRIYDLGERLARKGHEVHWLGMKYWPGEKTIKKNKLTLHGICQAKPLYTKNGKRSIFQAIYFSLHLLPELFRHKFDLIDCQSFPFFPSFSCKLYCLIKGKPLVITWLEVWNSYWHEYLGKFRGFFGRVVENCSAHLADEIIAISSQTKNDLIKKLRVPAKKIHFVPATGLNLERIGKIKKSRRKFDLLFSGRLIKEKNLELLIKSVKALKKKFPKITCAIVGEGPEKASLMALAKEHRLEKNISFLGFLPQSKGVFSLMKSTKIFAFPSLREGFGITAAEASACGLPVIIIDSPQNAAKELVKNGFNGFTVKNNERQFSQKIARLLSDSNLREKMSINAVNSAKQLDWNRIVEQIER